MVGSGTRRTASACASPIRYAKNPNEAEDIAQDALVRAWRRRSTLRDSAGARSGWATIVRNEAFRQHARVRPDPVDTLEDWEGAEDERSSPRSNAPTCMPRSSASTSAIASWSSSATTRT